MNPQVVREFLCPNSPHPPTRLYNLHCDYAASISLPILDKRGEQGIPDSPVRCGEVQRVVWAFLYGQAAGARPRAFVRRREEGQPSLPPRRGHETAGI